MLRLHLERRRQRRLVSQLKNTEANEPLPQIVADQLPLEAANEDDTADDTVSTGTTIVGLALGGTVDYTEIGVLRDDIEMSDDEDVEEMGPVTLGTAAYHDNDYFFGTFSLSYHRLTRLSSCPVLDDEAEDEDQSQLGSETPFESGGKKSFLYIVYTQNIHTYAQ
jgi:hypothetical protein